MSVVFDTMEDTRTFTIRELGARAGSGVLYDMWDQLHRVPEDDPIYGDILALTGVVDVMIRSLPTTIR